MESGGVPPLPPAMTRSASSPTIFSTSTPLNVPTTGTSDASGGKSAMSSTLPTTRSPAPILNRISVVAGVRLTTFSGGLGSSTAVPSSSVSVSGNDAPTDGVALAAGPTEPVASGGIVGRCEAELEQAEVATTTAKANVARTDRERRVANTTGSVSGREWQ